MAFTPQRTAPQQVAVAADSGTKQQPAGVLQIAAYASIGAAPSVQPLAEVVREHQVPCRCTSSCSLYGGDLVPQCGSNSGLFKMSSKCFHKQMSKVDFVFAVIYELTCSSVWEQRRQGTVYRCAVQADFGARKVVVDVELLSSSTNEPRA